MSILGGGEEKEIRQETEASKTKIYFTRSNVMKNRRQVYGASERE
jgi:hypothetical protein